MELQTIIFLGPQGCGKGTQLKLLADYLAKKDPEHPVFTPAMGNLLRDMSGKDTYAASLLRPVLEQGGLVEYAVSVSLFGNHVLENLKENNHLLIDGFPRSFEQVTWIDSAMHFFKRKNPTVIRIEISDEESLKRLALRKRSDDTPEIIKARLAWTRKAEKEIEEWFRAHQEYRFIEVNGEGKVIEEVQKDVFAALGLV